MKKILIVEDDELLLETLARQLSGEFHVITAKDGLGGLNLASRESPDLILMDLALPLINGFEVCKKLKSRASTRQIPIIMLTGDVTLDSRVVGLEVGADDYVSKPFQLRELIARIHARLRGRSQLEMGALAQGAGSIKIDRKTFQVWVDGAGVRITQVEFEILEYFLEHPNEVITRERLLGDLWPDSVVTRRTVDTHIAHLRKKITCNSPKLVTVQRAGYLLEVK